MPQLLGLRPGAAVVERRSAPFVRAAGSLNYVPPRHVTIRRLFPRSRIVELAQAGHWLHTRTSPPRRCSCWSGGWKGHSVRAAFEVYHVQAWERVP